MHECMVSNSITWHPFHLGLTFMWYRLSQDCGPILPRPLRGPPSQHHFPWTEAAWHSGRWSQTDRARSLSRHTSRGRAEPEIRARTLPALPATPFQDKGRCELQWFELVKIFIKTHCLDLCASTLKFPYFFGELCWLQPFQLRSAWIGSAYSEPSITGRLESRARAAPRAS